MWSGQHGMPASCKPSQNLHLPSSLVFHVPSAIYPTFFPTVLPSQTAFPSPPGPLG